MKEKGLFVRMPDELRLAAIERAGREERSIAATIRLLLRLWIDGSVQLP